MTIYEQRQHDKLLRDRYRDAATRLNPNVKVSPVANVSTTVDGDGAFVECTLWIPVEELECPTK